MPELIVVGFDESYRAAEVLKQLQALDAVLAIALQDAVAVYRTAEGKLEVEKSVRPTTKQGATRGAVLGALLGAVLVAPATAGASVAAVASVVGAGAATFGLTGAIVGAGTAGEWKEAAGITDDFIRQVAGMVQPGQSAVFVLADVTDPKVVEDHFRGYGGKVLRATLRTEDVLKLQDLLRVRQQAVAG